jgi:hypothetical protein
VVTAVVNGGDAVSDEDLGKLYRAAEDLLAAKRVEDERLAELFEWARTQKASWLAAELGYEISNLLKVISGKIRPKRIIARMIELRERIDADRQLSAACS